MDLYNWAIENDALDLPIGLKYQDEGGYYEGDTYQNLIDQNAKDEDLTVSIEFLYNLIDPSDSKYVLLA